MPGWIVQLIVSLAVKFGLPWLLSFPWFKDKWDKIMALFPNLPQYLKDIIQKLIDNLKAQEEKRLKKLAKKEARLRKVKDHCSGVACPTELKKEV